MKRIKYISRFATRLSAADIAVMVEKAARRNEALDVTGVLMTSGGLFFQVIEGPDDAVDEVLARIVSDDRHTDVIILSEESQLSSRLFPSWAMRKLNLDEESTDRLEPLRAIIETIVALKGRIDLLSDTLSRAIWNELKG